MPDLSGERGCLQNGLARLSTRCATPAALCVERRTSRILIAVLMTAMASACSPTPAQQSVVVSPAAVQMSPHRHDELPATMLARIRATTDTFESIDGISYEKAVDLYRRDVNPEENLVMWEAMSEAYLAFCRNRCSTPAERMDVYRSLLLRSTYPEEQALAKAELEVLSPMEARDAMRRYGLPPKPIDVMQAH